MRVAAVLLVGVVSACVGPRPPQAASASSVAVSDAPTPMDPAVRHARLPNGLTSYVLKNGSPRGRASLWLVVKAGSVLEDDDQRGVAHLIEHMAFNGTEHFPKQESVRFLEQMGMSPGVHFNAVTHFEHTHYELTVPTDAGNIAKALSFLRDIAQNISFEPAELDAERGVVLEEWRSRRDADTRWNETEWASLFAGSRYAQRLPIGLPELIRTVPRATVLRYYKDWYRPDTLAVIAVGDFEPGPVEQEIARQFGDMPASPQPRPIALPSAPPLKPLSVEVERDPEATATTIVVHDLFPHGSERSKRDYRRQLVERLFGSMVDARLLVGREGAEPLLRIRASYSDLSHDLSAFTCRVIVREDMASAGLRAVMGELYSISRYGFLAEELERARSRMLSRWARRHADESEGRSYEHAAELSRNFLEQEEVPGRRVENAWVHELVPGIALEELNALARERNGEQGRVISVRTSQSAILPEPSKLREVVATVAQYPPALPAHQYVQGPLLPDLPAPGHVTLATSDELADITTWTLQNGVRVIVKPLHKPGPNIRIEGRVPGGTSLLTDAEFLQARFATSIQERAGAGRFNLTQLRHLLAGKEADVRVRLGDRDASLSASTVPDDLETALQLMYLKVMQPRSGSELFKAWQSEQLEQLRHRDESPQAAFSQAVFEVEEGVSLRRASMTREMVERADPAAALGLWRQRFSNFNGATFVIVGQVEPDKIKGLVERYLGSLPSKPVPDQARDAPASFPSDKLVRTFSVGREPRSRVFLEFTAPDPWSLDAERDFDALGRVLQQRLLEVLRERMGNVYMVGVRVSLEREANGRHFLKIFFQSAPENVEKLRAAIFAELDAIAQSGVAPEQLETLAKQLRRQREQELKSEEFWLGRLLRVSRFGDDLKQLNDIDAVVARLTNDHIRAAAKRSFDPEHYLLVVQNPKPTPP